MRYLSGNTCSALTAILCQLLTLITIIRADDNVNLGCVFTHQIKDHPARERLTKLAGKRYSTSDNMDVYTYSIGICADADSNNLPQPNAGIVRRKKGSSTEAPVVVGKYDKANFVAGNNWIFLEYLGGEAYVGKCNNESRRGSIMILCDPNEYQVCLPYQAFTDCITSSQAFEMKVTDPHAVTASQQSQPHYASLSSVTLPQGRSATVPASVCSVLVFTAAASRLRHLVWKPETYSEYHLSGVTEGGPQFDLLTFQGSIQLLEENTDKDRECYFLFQMTHSAVCSEEKIAAAAGLSAGSIVVIVFSTLTGMYLLVGFLYQRFVAGAKGWEQMPHHSFWQDFGNLLADGCDLVCRSGSGRVHMVSTPASREYKGLGDDQLQDDDFDRDEHLLPM